MTNPVEFSPFATGTKRSGPVEFSPFPTGDIEKGISPRLNSRRVDLYPAVTQASPEEAELAVELDQEDSLLRQAESGAALAQSSRVQGIIGEGIKGEKSDEEVINQVAEQLSLSPFVSSLIDPVVLATVLTGDNEYAKRSQLAKLEKVFILNDLLVKRVPPKTGFWEWMAELGDVVATSSVPIRTNIMAKDRSDLAKKVLFMLDSLQSAKEFEEEATRILDEVSDQGIFTDENKLILSDFVDLLDPESFFEESESQKVWAWFDTLTVASGLFKPGIKGAAGIKNALGVRDAVTDSTTLLSVSGHPEETVSKVIKEVIKRDDPKTSATNLALKAPSSEVFKPFKSTFLSAPEHQALRQIEVENDLLASIRADVGPEFINSEIFQKAKPDLIRQAQEASEFSGGKRVIDHDIMVTEEENLLYTELWGTTKGAYFDGLEAAESLANDISGRVVPVGNGQYAVVLEQNVPLAPGGGNSLDSLQLFFETSPDDLGGGLVARIGHPAVQTTDDLHSILIQSEALKDKRLSAADKAIRSVGKKVSRKGKRAVDKVFRLLRDGKDSHMRRSYTPTEFRQRFRETNHREATEAEFKFYLAMQTRNDTAYFLQADHLFKDAVNQGQVVIKWNDLEVRAIRAKVESLPEDELVWSFDESRLLKKSELGKNENLYSVADTAFETPIGERVQYVSGDGLKTRRIFHSDVLNYNPGGPRISVSNSIKVFLKQKRELVLASGRKVSQEPITFMGVRNEAEAALAARELNNIIDVIKTKVVENGLVKGLGNDPDVIKAIRNNNTFHTGIQTVDDLVAFAKSTGLDLTKNVDWVPDGARLSDEASNFLPGISTSKTIVESFQIQSMGRGARKNQVLVGFGGKPNRVEPAIDTIQKNFVSTVAARTEAAYLIAATNGLMKAVLERGSKVLNKPLDQADFIGLTLQAKVAKLEGMINTKTEAGRRLALERDKLAVRLRKRGILDRVFNYLKDGVADTLYEKGFKRSAETVDMYSTNPIKALRGWVFDNFLGFFAHDQYFVQASQVANIVSVSGLSGIQGASAYPFIRFLLLNGHDNVAEHASKFLGPVLGLKSKQFKEMVDMLKENGRLVTNLSLSELGEGSAFTGGFQKVREAGRFFFKEGELTARITAHATAYIKYLKKFGVESANTQHGRRYIMREQDTLTQSMTSASRSQIESLPMAQFLAYTWRMTIQMVSGSVLGGKKALTNKQKLGMLTGHVALFGLTGIGMGRTIDSLRNKGQVNLDEDTYRMVRNGVLGVALTEILGTDVTLSGRLAWAEGLTDIISRTADSNLLDALAGPSGQVSSDYLTSFTHLVTSVVSAEPGLIKQDLVALGRQVKSGNMAYNAWIGWRLGLYVSRDGSSITADDVTKREAIALGLGMQLPRLEEHFARGSALADMKEYDKIIMERVYTLLTTWQIAAIAKDKEGMDTARRQVAMYMRSLPPEQQERLVRRIPGNFTSAVSRRLLEAYEAGLFIDRKGE